MKKRIIRAVEKHFSLKREMENLAGAVEKAANLITFSFKRGGTLYVCGNGGSAADSQHFAAELVGRFRFDRPPLRAVALTTDTSCLTCLSNDYGYGEVFRRQAEAFLTEKDVLAAISTSGNSENVVKAIEAARARDVPVISLTGRGGKIREISDVALAVDSDDTANIQEMHILLIHILCRLIEDSLFEKPQ